MDITNLNVAVVGSGTGGAATALLLARQGAQVTLFERIRQVTALGAGIGLAENGLAVLERLGLLAAIEAVSCDVGTGRVVTGEGRLLLAAPTPAPRVRMLRRQALQQVLLDAVAGEPRIAMRRGAEVLAARPDGTLDAAAPEGVDTVRADLVIGADGVHSRVRQGGAFGARVGAPGIPYVRAIVPEGLARGEEAWTAAGLFGSFPVPGGTYLYASAGTAACAAAAEAADLEAFRAIWARAYAPAGAMFTSLSSWHDLIVTRVVRVDCDRWVDGRLVLLGDAAHAMAPNLGQGGNSALVDAAVLVDELRRGPDLPSALQAWQVRRQPKVRAVADLSGRLGALAEITHPAARWVRDRVLPPIARMAASRSAGAMVLQEPPAVLAGTVVSRSS